MRFMTANDAKKNFGQLLDIARREPVSVQKHGRPVTVMLSIEDYEEYLKIQRDQLKAELQTGLDQLDRNEGVVVDVAGLDDFMDTVKTEGRISHEKIRAD